jgi:peptidoglycan/xylan/chitin deacetylase (PgdA/CDA1 family)
MSAGPPTGAGVILAYHHVADGAGAFRLSPSEFRGQMERVARERRPVALAELAQAAAGGEVPPGAVAVTFDDGYLDTLAVAAPILRELRIPATVFLTSDRLDDAGEHWWDVLERIFLGEHALPARLEVAALGGRGFATGSGPDRRATWEALKASFIAATLDERRPLLQEVAAWSGLDLRPRPSHRALGAAEVLRLAGVPGITIGCHSAHHLCLPLQPLDVQQREVAECRAALEALLGRPVTSFAYPYGEAGPETVRAVRAAGLETAVTLRPAPVVAGADPLLLPRFEMLANAALPLAARFL